MKGKCQSFTTQKWQEKHFESEQGHGCRHLLGLWIWVTNSNLCSISGEVRVLKPNHKCPEVPHLPLTTASLDKIETHLQLILLSRGRGQEPEVSMTWDTSSIRTLNVLVEKTWKPARLLIAGKCSVVVPAKTVPWQEIWKQVPKGKVVCLGGQTS